MALRPVYRHVSRLREEWVGRVDWGRYPRAPRSGVVEAPGPMVELLVIGDSGVMGAGAPDYEQALAGQVAVSLARRTGRAVSWRVRGRGGIKVGEGSTRLLPQVADTTPDVIVVVLGGNDAIAYHGPESWQRDLKRFLEALHQTFSYGPGVVMARLPPLGSFRPIPRPVRFAYGCRVRTLNKISARIVRAYPQVRLGAAQPTGRPELFGDDAYHPSLQGYTLWGDLLAETAAELVPPCSAPEDKPPKPPASG